MLTSRKILGLAATRQALTVVEVAPVARGRGRLVRAAELPLTAELGPHDPAKLGKALKELLHKQHFSASRCVIGLETAHLAAKEKRLPAAAAGSVDDILRIACEQDFASDGQDLLFDYVPLSGGAGAGAKGAGALLVAAPRPLVEQLAAAAEAARLNVVAVTSSALALAEATGRAAPGERLVLFLSSGGAELVVQSEGGPRLIRRLAAGAAGPADAAARQRYLADLEAELRRALAGLQGLAGASSGPTSLLVWNGVELDEAALRQMGERLAVPTRICSFSVDMAELDSAAGTVGDHLAPAVALALGQAAGPPSALNFLPEHSRLAVRSQRNVGRLVLWGAVAAALVLAGGVWLFLDWQAGQREIAQLRTDLEKMDGPVKQAKELNDKAVFANGWYRLGRPKFLQCMAEVASAFPQEGTIWATSVSVREDMHVVLSGKAVDNVAVLALQDRLNANPRLAKVTPLYTRQAGVNTREESFAISFSYVGAK